jgi:hypothetical protein
MEPALTSAEAARCQLGTALSLFLDDRDPVSVLCLASAGGEIAEQLASTGDQNAFSAYGLAAAAVDVAVLRQERNAYWSDFKAAVKGDGKSGRAVLADFSDVRNDSPLFVGWLDYANAVGKQPIEAQVFSFWYLAKRATESLAWSPLFNQFFGSIATMVRSAQKQSLRNAIALAQGSPTRPSRQGSIHARSSCLGRLWCPIQERTVLP